MAGTFIEVVNRITTELRRSNATDGVKNALNDAISEAATDRFYFNEMIDITFPTVSGQEYYSDLGFVELDAAWWLNGSSRYNVPVTNNEDLDAAAEGNVLGGQLQLLSHYAGKFRFYPIPTSIITIHLNGYGKLTPFPLAADADTNAWLTEGELYIRALTKRNYYRDIVRDYGEARVYDTIAEDYKGKLIERTAIKSSTGIIRSTKF